MTDRTTKTKVHVGKRSSEPRVVMLFRHRRHRSHSNKLHRSSTLDLCSNTVIQTETRPKDDPLPHPSQTESIVAVITSEESKRMRGATSVLQTGHSDPTHGQPKVKQRLSTRSFSNDISFRPSVVKNVSDKHSSIGVQEEAGDGQADQVETIHLTASPGDSTIDANAKREKTMRTVNDSDAKTTVESFGRTILREEAWKESKKKRRRNVGKGWNGCRCTRVRGFLYMSGGIVIGTVIVAVVMALLNVKTAPISIFTTVMKMSTSNSATAFTGTTWTNTSISTAPTTFSATTTSIMMTSSTATTSTTTTSSTSTTSTTATSSTSTTTTTTTTTTTSSTTTTATITYVPTGIYALQIPTCATWNTTGFTVSGNMNGVAGNDTGSLDSPVSIFVDNNYTLFVCDRDNNRIMRYYANATVGVIVAGNSTQGNSASQLSLPKGVAVDQMGAVIVADSYNYRIQRFPFGSTVGTTIAINSPSNVLGQTRDLHIDVNNGIYVTDSDYSRVVKYYPNNGVGVTLAGTHGAGSRADQFLSPFGNFVDGNQTLYVADYSNQRVQKWLAGATNGTTLAGVTNVSSSSLTNLYKPTAIIVDNNGYVYISDSGNNRIVRWTDDYSAGGTCIVGCSNTPGKSSTQLNNPRDLKFDPSGNLYVSDQGNNRVQKFAIQISANCSTAG